MYVCMYIRIYVFHSSSALRCTKTKQNLISQYLVSLLHNVALWRAFGNSLDQGVRINIGTVDYLVYPVRV